MKIGELSRRTGVSIRMLRYYEAEGLLAPERTEGGYRDYEATDEDMVERIRLLGDAGMTLSTIRAFMPCSIDRRGEFEPCDELKSKLHQQICLIDDRRRKLAKSRKILGDLLAEFEASSP